MGMVLLQVSKSDTIPMLYPNYNYDSGKVSKKKEKKREKKENESLLPCKAMAS